MTEPLHFVVPGRLDQRTGGYIYDRRIVDGLRDLGRVVRVHEVHGRFPALGEESRAALARELASIPDGARAVVDGLALGAAPEVARAHAGRVRLLALVHHPLCDETGLAPAERDALLDLESRVLEAVRGVIVTSPTTGRRIVELGVDTNRARVVKPGTDPADPASGPGPGAPPRLLCVGTVTPRKGQDLLVQALVSLREEEWDCVCVGSVERDAAFAESVIGAVRSAGLEERIRFTGEVTPERLDEEWRAASVFVSPSWYEGYGMALTEAVARGLPIITTRGGAIPETVPEAVAIRIETGDVDALTTAISTLVRDPEARAERAAAARHLAASLPRWPEQADRFHRAVEELTDVT